MSFTTQLLLFAGPVNGAPLDGKQQAVERYPHQADDEDADEDVIRAQEASGIDDHPADAGASGDDLGGDQGAVDETDGETRAGEDLGEGRGKHDVAKDLPRARAQGLRGLDTGRRDVAHAVAGRDR